MHDILINTFMTRHVPHLASHECVKTALDLMTKENLSCIIVSEKSKPVGIVTERDIVRLLHKSTELTALLSLTLSQIMTSPIISLRQDQLLFDALVISETNNIRHIPVLDEQEQLVGLITNTDLAKVHFKLIETQSKFIEESVHLKTKELVEANEELMALSMEDHLMGIGNRRSMEVDLQYTHSAAHRYQQIYSVVLMDLDNFKSYNDHYGHIAGDKALQTVASHIKSHIRKADRVYRYGGEEVLILLPSTNELNSIVAANKLVESLADQSIPHAASPTNFLTISAGVATFNTLSTNTEENDWKKLLIQADEALYQAKEDGRNRAVAA